MPKILTIFLLITIFTFEPLAAQDTAGDTPLGLLLEQHQTTVDKLGLSRAAKVSKLNPKYEAALERIKKVHQASGDLEAILAIGHELKTYSNPPSDDAASTPGKASPELLLSRETFRKSIAAIDQSSDAEIIAETRDTLASLKALAKKYAATDKLDEAIAADAAHKQLEASEEFKTALARNAASGVAKDSTQSIGMDAALPRSGLVAHYKFDGNLRDSEGGADIALGGKKAYAAGIDGRALSIDNGHGKKINYIDALLPQGGKSSFTLSFCFEADMGAHSNRTLIGIGTGKAKDMLLLQFQRGGEDQVSIISERPDNWEHVDGGAERPGKAWFHVLVTVEPNLVNYYTNGRLMTTLKTSKAFDTTGMMAHIPMHVSKSNDDNGNRVITKNSRMDCLIDELAIYDRALRSNEIREIAKSYQLSE